MTTLQWPEYKQVKEDIINDLTEYVMSDDSVHEFIHKVCLRRLELSDLDWANIVGIEDSNQWDWDEPMTWPMAMYAWYWDTYTSVLCELVLGMLNRVQAHHPTEIRTKKGDAS